MGIGAILGSVFGGGGSSGFLGSIGSALGSGIGSLGLQGLSNSIFGGSYDDAVDDQRWNMMHQNEVGRQNYQHRYQWTMEDLRKAGLNPILAARGLSGSIPQMGSASGPGPNYAPIQASDLRTFQEMEKADSETKLNMQKINESIDSAAEKRAAAGLMTQQEKNIIDQHHKLQAETQKLIQQAYAEKAQGDVRSQTVKLLKMQVEVINQNLARLKAISSVYGHPVGQWFQFLQEMNKSIPILGIITQIGGGK